MRHHRLVQLRREDPITPFIRMEIITRRNQVIGLILRRQRAIDGLRTRETRQRCGTGCSLQLANLRGRLVLTM